MKVDHCDGWCLNNITGINKRNELTERVVDLVRRRARDVIASFIS